MKWTTDHPAVEGWYFWRLSDNSAHPSKWCAYYVSAKSKFKAAIEYYPPRYLRAQGQWLGPIQIEEADHASTSTQDPG